MLNNEKIRLKADEIWKSAIKLRGKFKAYEYQNVILPVIMLRRIECVLEENRKKTRQEVIDGFFLEQLTKLETEKKDKKALEALDEEKRKLYQEIEKMVKETETSEYEALYGYFNTTSWTIDKILNTTSSQEEKLLREYINGFSKNIEEIFDRFDFQATITTMEKNGVLQSILKQYRNEALSPTDISNLEMGYIYEELLRKFSEQSGEEAGEHFTPREVIHLMVELMDVSLNPKNPKTVVSIYDPACGTGGMLSVAKEHLMNKYNVENLVQVELYGQERNPKNYAICKADMLLKGEKAIHERITYGNSLIPNKYNPKENGDQHVHKPFDYMLSNPPFGVNWSEYQDGVKKLLPSRYHNALPTIKDGALLFLLTMIGKMKTPVEGGSKIAIIFNGSPLSNGDALSGESEIRKYILENHLLDAIVMLPDQMFYNTGIFTYIWILNNNRPVKRKEQILIINAREQFSKEPKAFASKRNRIEPHHRAWIVEQYKKYKSNDACQTFHYTDFAFRKVAVVFHQTDENDKPMNITEPFPVKVNNKNIEDKVKFYGGKATFHLTIVPNSNEADVFSLDMSYTEGDKSFDKVVKIAVEEYAKTAQKTIDYYDLQDVAYTHKHYISDFEYVPFKEDFKAFIHREIDKPIISIDENPPIGYEVLPNKYFFKYQEPPKAVDVLSKFWDLERDAQLIIKQLQQA